MIKSSLLMVNVGSSSLKASLFLPDGSRRNFLYAHQGSGRKDREADFRQLFEVLGDIAITAVGHRIVHGGDAAEAARIIDAGERARLDGLAHLAPLHMPDSLLGIDLCAGHFAVPQVACFDTAFHRTMPEMARRLPLPVELRLERYGFHGINYAYVARVLPDLLADAASRRIVVAHLGNGASLCLLENLRSVDTTMGLTPIGGIPMGTRSGDLDPGVVLELGSRMDTAALHDLFYHRSGLLALSGGRSSDMATLLRDGSAEACFALDYFCNGVRAAIGAFAAKHGDIDGLVFSGGIGEHASQIRERICGPLGFMGFSLAQKANAENAVLLSSRDSKPVWCVAADEALMMAEWLKLLLHPA